MKIPTMKNIGLILLIGILPLSGCATDEPFSTSRLTGITTSPTSRVKNNSNPCEITRTCNINKAQLKHSVSRPKPDKSQSVVNSNVRKSSQGIRRDQLHNDSLTGDVKHQDNASPNSPVDKENVSQDHYKSIGFTFY